jgi:hypothetical protein
MEHQVTFRVNVTRTRSYVPDVDELDSDRRERTYEHYASALRRVADIADQHGSDLLPVIANLGLIAGDGTKPIGQGTPAKILHEWRLDDGRYIHIALRGRDDVDAYLRYGY